MASTVEHCENYESIEEAVREAICYWPEHGGDPRPMVLDDPNGAAAVTFVPIGTEGTEVLVVYNVSGIQVRYENIHYVTEGERWETHYVENGQNLFQVHSY